MAEASSGPRARPKSPHLGIWRWHITLAVSILHRLTGMALYAGALIFAAFAASLAAGPEAYGRFQALAGSLVGRLVLLGLTLAVFYHMANGVRHLVWDFGEGFAPKTANATAVAVLVFAALATAVVWGLALRSGGGAG